MKESIDTHFQLDNVTPKEFLAVIKALRDDCFYSPDEIAVELEKKYMFKMQDDHTYTPRRLFDLDLVTREKNNNKISYRINERGVKIKKIIDFKQNLIYDVLHYLHYTSYDKNNPISRKLLWSYYKGCYFIWSKKKKIEDKEMSSHIQSEIRLEFNQLEHTSRIGARFSSKASSSIKCWINVLDPCPFSPNKKDRSIYPRIVQNYELALLALDDLYRRNEFSYGTPVLLNEDIVNQLAGVFFLDLTCFRELLRIASKVTTYIKLDDARAGGQKITLLRPYTIMDIR